METTDAKLVSDEEKKELAKQIYDVAKRDGDITEYASAVEKTALELMMLCDMYYEPDETTIAPGIFTSKTSKLLEEYICFLVGKNGGPTGGSCADYCYSAAAHVIDSGIYTLRVNDESRKKIEKELIPVIRKRALYPERELKALEQAMDYSSATGNG